MAARLVFFVNPVGDLSINDFELAGHVAQLWLALPLMAPLTAILSGSDNITSIYWIRKGSTTTSTTAGSLVRLCSWLLRKHQVAAPITFLAGKDNPLADAASRRWDLTNSQLCSLFDHVFPQATSWKMLCLTLQRRHGLSSLCQDKVAAGVHSSRASTDRTNWRQWCAFCLNLRLDPSLAGVQDPIPLLQMFAHQVCTGQLAADGRPVRKQTMEQYLCSVAQIFASVGAPDPRHNALGKTGFRLYRQFRTYDKQDPLPTRVRPVPLQLLVHMHETVDRLDNAIDHQRAVTDLALMAFFFLLRPGEYCKSGPDTESHPFRLQDVTFSIGKANYNAATAPLDCIIQANYVALYFTTQKNGIHGGEPIGHGASGHAAACPLCVIRRRVLYL
jgi:hypothetical protein